MSQQIRINRQGAVQTIAFNNPPMNFISHVMLKELYEELLRLREDPAVRVLVLTGGMPDSFVTHYDVGELLALARRGKPTGDSRLGEHILSMAVKLVKASPRVERMVHKAVQKRSSAEQGIFYWARVLELLDTMPKPVIAAISGLCLGGGCEIALCCDFRYMADQPQYRIGLPEVLVGIIPGGTGTHLRLPRIVGEARALEMLLTGELYTPEQAQQMGLIHQALPSSSLMPEVMALASKLARGAPLAQAAIKRNVREGARMAYADAQALDLAVTNVALFSKDADKGMAHYVEKVSAYRDLDLDRVLEDTTGLREGQEITFHGD